MCVQAADSEFLQLALRVVRDVLCRPDSAAAAYGNDVRVFVEMCTRELQNTPPSRDEHAEFVCLYVAMTSRWRGVVCDVCGSWSHVRQRGGAGNAPLVPPP